VSNARKKYPTSFNDGKSFYGTILKYFDFLIGDSLNFYLFFEKIISKFEDIKVIEKAVQRYLDSMCNI
jgi:hypothetical protein